MPCERVTLPGGSMAIICTRGRSRVAKVCQATAECHGSGTKLCDWPTAKGKTCDLRSCQEHAHNVGHEVDYCPAHWEIREQRRKANAPHHKEPKR